jgi:hypothetical protein
LSAPEKVTCNRVQCTANLKEIALAVHSYHDANGRIPYNQFGPYGGGGEVVSTPD